MVPTNFYEVRVKITCGERRAFGGFATHIQSDKTARFLLLFVTFSFKKKKLTPFQKRGSAFVFAVLHFLQKCGIMYLIVRDEDENSGYRLARAYRARS